MSSGFRDLSMSKAVPGGKKPHCNAPVSGSVYFERFSGAPSACCRSVAAPASSSFVSPAASAALAPLAAAPGFWAGPA
jgi:hypothetical protein